MLVAFYYGITGISCAWAFRKVLFTSVSLFLLAGLLPFIGGIFLFWVGYQVIAPDVSAAVPILIAVGLGIPLTIVAAMLNKNGFFREKTVSYVKQNGRLMAYVAGGRTMELAGATVGAPAAPVEDPAAQNRSSNE